MLRDCVLKGSKLRVLGSELSLRPLFSLRPFLRASRDEGQSFRVDSFFTTFGTLGVIDLSIHEVPELVFGELAARFEVHLNRL